MIPILFETEHISIKTLWVFVVIALLVTSYLAVKRLKHRRVNFNLFIEHSASFLLSALITSRIVYFIFHTDAYFPAFDLRTVWNFIAIWDQGFSFWGAVIGFFAMLTYRIIKSKEQLWKWYDALIVPSLIGIAIGYFGAFLGGVAYGTPTILPWGVTYEAYTVKYTVPIHPTQIYAIILIGLMLWSKQYYKRKTDFFKREGNTSIYLTTCFSFAYFLLEFVRGDDTLYLLDLRISMIIAFIVFLINGVALFRRYKAFKSKS